MTMMVILEGQPIFHLWVFCKTLCDASNLPSGMLVCSGRQVVVRRVKLYLETYHVNSIVPHDTVRIDSDSTLHQCSRIIYIRHTEASLASPKSWAIRDIRAGPPRLRTLPRPFPWSQFFAHRWHRKSFYSFSTYPIAILVRVHCTRSGVDGIGCLGVCVVWGIGRRMVRVWIASSVEKGRLGVGPSESAL